MRFCSEQKMAIIFSLRCHPATTRLNRGYVKISPKKKLVKKNPKKITEEVAAFGGNPQQPRRLQRKNDLQKKCVAQSIFKVCM